MRLTYPLVVPGIRLRNGDVDAETERAVRRAREPWVAGFCLFGGTAETVRDLLAALRREAGRPIFVASDMEHGAGQQVGGLYVLPETEVWGTVATPVEVERFGELAARDARSVGVDVLFAPVVDVLSERHNPIVGHRAFGWDPARVALLGTAFVRGVLAGGALPVLKHYPGHGATSADSHTARPVVREPEARLLGRDLAPFLSVLAQTSCPAVMAAHVAYPTLDPSGVIATFSRPILDRLPRGRGERDLVVFTDALCMEGARAEIGEPEAARRALQAGCDLLLCPDDVEGVATGVAELPDDVLGAAADRVHAFLSRPERSREVDPVSPGTASALGLEVAQRAVEHAWNGRPETEAVLVLDDDGVRGRGHLFEERGRQVGVKVGIARPGADPVDGRPQRAPGTVVVMASVRAYKGSEGLGRDGRSLLAAIRERAAREGRPLQVVWMGVRGPLEEPYLAGTTSAVEAALARVLLPASP